MKISIHRTQNGAWVRTIETDLPDGDESIYKDRSYVFDAYKKDGDDMSGLREMLYDILDDMGWTGDRHDQQRIKVSIAHGDKYECQTECDICKEKP